MGLTIHYTLTATRKLDEKEVRQRVQQTARLAWRIGCEYVGKVLPSAASDPHAPACFDSRADNERRMFGGSRTRGWLVEILPGAGCETITLGLCQQYRLVTRDPKGRQKHWWPVYQPDGWMFNAFCKTYYVAEHGLEHFVQCHERIIHLLDLWCRADVSVRVHDEGGFWKNRDRKLLAAQIGDINLFRKVAQSRECS